MVRRRGGAGLVRDVQAIPVRDCPAAVVDQRRAETVGIGNGAGRCVVNSGGYTRSRGESAGGVASDDAVRTIGSRGGDIDVAVDRIDGAIGGGGYCAGSIQ